VITKGEIMKLTAKNVEEVFKDCLFYDLEDTSNAVLVDGVTGKFGFNPDRLKEHEKNITSLLNGLPKEFKRDSGGGWSFLNACNDKDGNQWTGLHLIMEQLVVLGIATKKVEFTLPKDMWSILPGGMPYFTIE
jgi:hypothetical protein